MVRFLCGLLAVVPLMACSSSHQATENAGTAPVEWAVVVHGGAGTLERGEGPEMEAAYRAALKAAIDEGKRRAEAGEPAMDVAEAVVRMLEDNELFNAGRGAALTDRGRAELDASIMDGATLRAGAVAGVMTVKNPVSLARLVMEKTRHVLLAGDGAEQFATSMGVQRMPPEYFVTPRRQKMLEEYLNRQKRTGGLDPAVPLALADDAAGHAWSPMRFGTVGCVVRDKAGNLAAATSTGGLTGKKWGRIGDSPIIGAGCYANKTVAVSCTGTGEQFIRHTVARSLAARMELKRE
ncbi:MAG TPA: isoaspartyl peptidase/L-asparaginase, partial [Phycisphaerales bacterium]|nr:isoaspartyl peptidase/L-asparaginase [Phycisphaerales bacterium]